MSAPALVIMAAGMGSRYGGLKQIDPVDDKGHIIMDFSIHDALAAGFGKVIFVIRRENEEAFREAVGRRVEALTETAYVFQELTDLPEGFAVPEGRTKPWGTGHAVLAARGEISGPFAVINADDFYGRDAFRILYDHLSAAADDEKYRYVMAGYVLGNTLTENGSVSRGVCQVDGNGYLTSIRELKKIVRTKEAPGAAYYTEDGELHPLSAKSPVSLNVWGFTPSFIRELEARFPVFLEKALAKDPLKAEFFLPSVVEELLVEEKATAKVEMTEEKWYGITYREDKEKVTAAIREMEEAGKYVWK